MAVRPSKHVATLKQSRFDQVMVDDEVLREKVRNAYLNQDMQEFSVAIVLTDDETQLRGRFTAAAIVQLTNQTWVKTIVEQRGARMC